MSFSTRRFAAWMGLGLVASTLVACSGSVTGGIVGAVLTVIGGGLLFFGASSQAGCSSVFGPCLSPVMPERPASDAPPSVLPPSGAPESVASEPAIGPCLKVVPPEVPSSTPPSAPPSTQPKSASSKDKPVPVHPCLSIIREPVELPEAIPQGTYNQGPLDVDAIKAKLIAQGALPPDVVDRLG